ncbi:retrovirus-related pol polyprotein from transposon TNT 1-94 [Tanacetum coccineum]
MYECQSIPTSRINSIHPSTLILGDPQSVVQTRSKVTKSSGAHAFILVDLPYRKKAIGTKWVYKNKKDEKGVVVRNKARLVAQKSWCDEFEALMKSRFQMSSMGELTFFLGLQVKQKEDGIFISQDKMRAAIDVELMLVLARSSIHNAIIGSPVVSTTLLEPFCLSAKSKIINNVRYITAKVVHAQSEEVQELLYKLLRDLQIINEELAEYINTPSCNFPASSYDDDDDEYSFAIQEYLMTCSTAITPDSPKTDSLIMVDKHLDTIPETESDEFIKSSVENLVQNPSESEDECECDMPDYDDSQTTNFSTFSNPFFDDSTSSDDESSHVEEKSPTSSSHRGFEASKLFHHKSPMLICGEDIPSWMFHFSISILLDKLKYRGSSQAQDSVNRNKRFDFPDFEASRAHGFVLRSLELHILSFIMRIQYPNLID